MSVHHLYFVWAVSPEGDPWVQHECLGGRREVWRCPPPWRLVEDRIEPSFHCTRCGRHVVLGPADRVPWPAEYAPIVTCTETSADE